MAVIPVQLCSCSKTHIHGSEKPHSWTIIVRFGLGLCQNTPQIPVSLVSSTSEEFVTGSDKNGSPHNRKDFVPIQNLEQSVFSQVFYTTCVAFPWSREFTDIMAIWMGVVIKAYGQGRDSPQIIPPK